jgi:hypothetical protein
MDHPLNALAQTVRNVVQDYSGLSIGSTTYAVNDDEQQMYTVVIVPDHPRRFKARVMVMARVVDDKVIIDEDTTDRPLVSELLQAGIRREKIVLAYLPEESPV